MLSKRVKDPKLKRTGKLLMRGRVKRGEKMGKIIEIWKGNV